MEIIYRTLNEGDLIAYRQIRLDCLQNHPENFGSLYENESNSKALKFDKVLKQENDRSFLFGAFENEELIAICGFTREERMKTKHRGNISQMYVRYEFGGKGIGKELLKNTLNKAFKDGSLEIIELGVVTNNKKAIQLYSHFGFKKYGQFDKYFKFENKYWDFTLMDLKRENYFNNR